MRDVSSPAAVRALLKDRGLSPNKQLGQNFLCDANIIKRIADAAGVNKADAVLEIGPGLGALTRELCDRADRVVAVEIDSGLAEVLKETLSDKKNATVIHGDFLKCDLAELHDVLGGGPFRVAANLPYYITTAIIMRLLESGLPVLSMSFLIQKEVAERMAAAPKTKSYGSLSIAVQYYTDVSVVLNVPRGCFLPSPGVDSVVVRLNKRPPKVDVPSEEDFFRITRAAFAMRRKTLANNLSVGLGISKERAEALIKAANLPENVRGEELSLEQFAQIARVYAHDDR
ncbi:MAG: 16S rRNA (adenine(1518)-N(6)/adenine(1519)-N(6))-dimethyltransferase RsmA [Christensenellales bacterium]